MSKSRDRDKKVAFASALGVLVLAGLLVLSWDGLRAWYVGYRFIWLPEGATPMQSGQWINESGEVVVELRLDPQGTRAGLWSWSLTTREVAPFLWSKDAGVRDFATLGGERTVSRAVNERGQVVGWSTSPSHNQHAFLWSAESGIADLGSLAPGMESDASAINDAGWVVGDALAADGWRHPFLWKPGTRMQDLGLPSGFSGGGAIAINDHGDVLVNFENRTNSTPFLWSENDGLVQLPAPPGFDNVWGAALNNRGTVLLRASPSNRSLDSIGYLIVNGVFKELPGAPGAKATRYYGLNDKGWLVGAAQTRDEGDSWRAFVALPVR